MVTEYIT